jgi:opine dehydrogenase
MNVLVVGAGAGGAAAVAELTAAGHAVMLWGRSRETLAPFLAQGGIGYEGVLGTGLARARLMTNDLAAASGDAEIAVVTLPTFAHVSVAHDLVSANWPREKPIVLNPGHTGGALEFRHAFRSLAGWAPPIAEFSTLTYVARKYSPDRVTISGRAKQVRAAALPGAEDALQKAIALFPGAVAVRDVLAADLANANLVLHPPCAILGAAWVEARAGDFTFYVDGMTAGVARVMRQLDDERRAVAAAFGHLLPNLIEEMKLIGTVEANVTAIDDFVGAIAGGEANKRIKAPSSLDHRYYREDFGHGLLPFIELAHIAGIDTPVASALLALAQPLCANDFRKDGRTAERMGIAGLNKTQLIEMVRTS